MPKQQIEPIYAEIGGKIKQARLMKGFSQTELGSYLGVTFQQIQKYESGTNRCAVLTLKKISEVTEKPFDWFFETHSPTEAKLLSYFRQMPEQDQKGLLTHVVPTLFRQIPE